MRRFHALSSLPLLLLATLAHGQEKAPPGAAAAARNTAKAIHKLGDKDLLLSGSVTEKKPTSDPGGNRTLVLAPGYRGERFQGEMDLLRTAEGELIAVSRKLLPGVEVFANNSVCLHRVLLAKRPLDAQRTARDLSRLLNLEQLADAVRNARMLSRTRGDKGLSRQVFAISPSFLPSDGGMLGEVEPRVQQIRLEVTLNRSRRVQTLRFSVIRSDPLAGIRRQAEGGGFDGGGVSVDDGAPTHSAKGVTTVYAFERSSGKPSERLEASLDAMREAAKAG